MALEDTAKITASYEAYEAEYERLEKENNELLEIFMDDLEGTLSPKTIDRHYMNIEFFLNGFLARNLLKPYDQVVEYIDEFLGYFFIRKCMWSTPETIKQNCASFKKFYGCMVKHEKFPEEKYKVLCDEIKCMKEPWMEECERFNNMDDDFFF